MGKNIQTKRCGRWTVEKISFIRDAQVGPEGYAYRASEVDALLTDVRALVEAITEYVSTTAKCLDETSGKTEATKAADNFKQAIAAVEARIGVTT